MTYFNYFSQCSRKTGAGGSGKKTLITLAVLLVIIGAGLYGYNCFLCAQYQRQMDYLRKLEADDGLRQQYELAQAVSGRLSSARNDLLYLELLDRFVDTASTANRNLLELIKDSMPDGTSMKSVNVDDTEVEFDGTTSDIQTLKKMEISLRESGAFSKVLVSTIENREETESGVYFCCELTLDGGAIVDEAKES